MASLLLLWASPDLAITQSDAKLLNALAVLLLTGLLAEIFALRLGVGTGSTTSSVVFVPNLAAIILVGPGWAMLIAGTTELVAEGFFKRKPLIKILHNTAKEVIAVGVAGYLYVIAGGSPSYLNFAGTFNIPAFLAASLTYFLVVNGLVSLAIVLSTDADLSDTWNHVVSKGLVENVLSSSISVLLAYLYTALGTFGLALVIAPLFFVRNAHRVTLSLEQANRDLLELMVKSIEARDPYTSGHSVRVATLAKALARSLGLTSKETEQIETAALLHDVGKIYEEFAPLLRKRGRLTEGERLVMRTHPIRSAELVGTISSLRGHVEHCVRAHHESFDGAGYPDGLAGNEIPIGARIIMVADTADAMMTDRPYRKALSYEHVVEELEKYSGAQFDPEVVRSFRSSAVIRRMIGERRIPDISDAEQDAFAASGARVAANLASMRRSPVLRQSAGGGR
jgi:putative nucleotidyltransferase with HDIG domain